MFKSLLAGAAVTALLAFGAQAQESQGTTQDPAPAPGMAAPESMPPPAEGDLNPEAAAGAPAPTEDGEAPQTAEESDAVAPVAPPTDTAVDAAPAPAGPLPEGAVAMDVASVSPDTLIGTDIRTFEGDSIAAVDDVMISAEGKVENLVARFGGFLGFGETKVLVAPDELTLVREADDTVFIMTSLTADELQARPAYTAPETLGPEG